MHTITRHLTGASTRSLALSLSLVALLAPLCLTGFSPRVLAASCTAPSTTYGTDTVSLSLNAAATYSLWARVKAPSTAKALLMNVDGSHCYDISARTANSWQWVNADSGNGSAAIKLSLSAGSHSLKFTGLANGTELDRIEAIPSGSCTPTGTGDNCVNAASTTGGGGGGGTTTTSGGGLTTTTPAGSSGSTDTGSNAPITVQPTQQSGVTKVEYLLNNKLIDTETTPPFSYTFNPKNYLNGTYTLTVKTYDSSGNVTTSSKQITVKNTALVQAKNLALHNLWLVAIVLLALIGGVWYIRRRGNAALATAEAPTEPSDFYSTYNQAGPQPPTAAVPPSLQGGMGGYPSAPGMDTSGMDIFEQPAPQAYPSQPTYPVAPGPEPQPIAPPTPEPTTEPAPIATPPAPTPEPTPTPAPNPPTPDNGEGEFTIRH